MSTDTTFAETQTRPEQLTELDAASLLDQIVDTGIRPNADGRERAEHLVRAFASEIVDPGTIVGQNLLEGINARIDAIDRLISEQMDEILHAPALQRLEATWRGLGKLVKGTETSETLKLEVLDTTKDELVRDFQSASEFTESALWKRVYENEFGTFGGAPFGALIGDYEFDKSNRDVELLLRISEVAAAAHAPFVSAAAPGMFNLASFTELGTPRSLEKIFDRNNPENTKWLAFRDSENANFVALVLPHTLGRVPYGDQNPIDGFNYQETVDLHEHYLWTNATYDYAGILTRAFANYRWCVTIRGPEGGGRVSNLEIHTFNTGEGDVASKCPTEVLIPDTREKELSDLGFIGLLNCKNTDFAAFFGGNSVQRPKKYDVPEATASARLSSQIPYLLASSRIAHYLKVICRDKVGSFMSRADCQEMLTRWIQQYTVNRDDADTEMKAKRPLREAKITVFDDPARPGCYKARAHLRPHYQLDEITVSLGLVVELPASKG